MEKTIKEMPTPNRMMNDALKSTMLLMQARRIYIEWPCLKKITERFCGYVTPLLDSKNGNRNLIEDSLARAIESYSEYEGENEKEKARAFVMALTESAEQLVTVVIRGMARRTMMTWHPFEEPISSWMLRNNIKYLKTTINRSANAEHAQILLLGKILTFSDMEMLGLSFRTTRSSAHPVEMMINKEQPKLRLVTES
jgi:hypothetical protein